MTPSWSETVQEARVESSRPSRTLISQGAMEESELEVLRQTSGRAASVFRGGFCRQIEVISAVSARFRECLVDAVGCSRL